MSIGSSSQPFALGSNQSGGGGPLTFVGAGPRWSTYDPYNGFVYVSNYGSANVTVLSGANNAVVATVSLAAGSQPGAPTFDPRNGYVYVPETNSPDKIVVINGATNYVVANLSVPSGAPHSITFDPTNGYLYVPSWGGKVTILNGIRYVGNRTVGTNPLNAAYDSKNNLVYVANQGSNNISIINATGNNVTNKKISVGTSPTFVTFDPANGYLYVDNKDSSNVSILNGKYNAAQNGITATVCVGSTPLQPILDLKNGLIYVPNNGSNNVSIINGSALNSAKSNLAVGTGPMYAAYDMVTGYLYVPNYASANVTVINETSNTVLRSLSVGTNPRSAIYDYGNGVVYVVNSGTANVTAILTAEVGLVSTNTIGSTAGFAAVDTWNGNIYVPNNGSNNLSVVNPVANTVTNVPLPSNSHPLDAVFDSRNGRVYVTETGTGKLSAINGTTLVANITVGSSPTFVTFSPSNGYLYVSNSGGSNITVVNGATNKVVVSSISVKSNPRNSTLDGKDGYLFVADYCGGLTGFVSVINVATNRVLRNVTVGQGPMFPGYDFSNGKVYVPNSNSDNVTVIKASSYSVKGNISLSTLGDPHSAIFDPANGYIYISSWGAGVAAINQTTSGVTYLNVGTNPLFANPNPSTGYVYVNNNGGSNVSVLNGTANVTSINVGSTPVEAVYNGLTGAMYVPNAGSGNLSGIGMTGPLTYLFIATHATNATIGWTDASTSYNTLRWGNTTGMSFTAELNTRGNSGTFSLDYLNSNTTYYYKITTASCSGCAGPSYSGLFKTGPVIGGTQFTGLVQDVNGSLAPTDIWLEAECAAVQSGYSGGVTFATTGSGGSFSLGVPYSMDGGGYSAPCIGYQVDVMNSWWYGYNIQCDCNEWQTGGAYWHDRWNETVFTYQPQRIVFNLPLAVKVWVPLTYEFDNNNSAFPSFQFLATETTTTSNWTSFNGYGINSSKSVTLGTGDGSPAGQGLEVEKQYNSTGRVMFDPLTNRTPYATAPQYYAPRLATSTGAPSISDWKHVTDYNAANCTDWHAEVQRGYYHDKNMTVSGTLSHTQGLTGSLSIGVSFPGDFAEPDISWSIPFSFGMTMSASNSAQLEVQIYIPTSATYLWYGFDICFEGNAASYATSGLVAHVWQVAASNTKPW